MTNEKRLEMLEKATDRLEKYVTSLMTMAALPANVHVAVLRRGLPEILDDFRTALKRDPDQT